MESACLFMAGAVSSETLHDFQTKSRALVGGSHKIWIHTISMLNLAPSPIWREDATNEIG